MKNSKLFYVALLILPWLTVPLLGRNSFKKYLPAAILCVHSQKQYNYSVKRKNGGDFIKEYHL
jgi:hypothetical protein